MTAGRWWFLLGEGGDAGTGGTGGGVSGGGGVEQGCE